MRTYTYAILEIDQQSFDEIKELLSKAGYEGQFYDEGKLIDMHGIAVKIKPKTTASAFTNFQKAWNNFCDSLKFSK